jgi:hypothetical protein
LAGLYATAFFVAYEIAVQPILALFIAVAICAPVGLALRIQNKRRRLLRKKERVAMVTASGGNYSGFFGLLSAVRCIYFFVG